jgi:hypothetical protein
VFFTSCARCNVGIVLPDTANLEGGGLCLKIWILFFAEPCKNSTLTAYVFRLLVTW